MVIKKNIELIENGIYKVNVQYF